MAKISIIIPCRTIDDDVVRCVHHCKQLSQDKEIIVVPDWVVPGLPATKRNWAMQQAKGDIYAFIDSDAYPNPQWLEKALYWLQTFKAVCGPGVLPPNAPYKERVADKVHSWLFCPYRVQQRKPQIVSWYPTFNLIVHKEVATDFEAFLTGEDDKFGLNIKGGIFYHPDILVYHNRRGAFKPLWRQFATWGRHKGVFKAMALVAWLTTLFVYVVNWIKGFVTRRVK